MPGSDPKTKPKTKPKTEPNTESAAESSSFSGRARQRKTSFRVKFSDVAARVLITLAGIGTIIAVSTVFLFLVWVAADLFMPGSVETRHDLKAPVNLVESEHSVLRMATDDHLNLGYVLLSDGRAVVFDLKDGILLEEQQVFDGSKLTASYFSPNGEDTVLSFNDGTVLLGTLGFKTTFINEEDIPDDLRGLPAGTTAIMGNGVGEITPEGQFRKLVFEADLASSVRIALPNQQITQISKVQRTRGPKLALLTDTGQMYIASLRANPMTGGFRRPSVDEVTLDAEAIGRSETPDYLLMSGQGDQLYAAWDDGFVVRFDARTRDAQLVEQFHILPEASRAAGVEVTLMQFILGNTTFVVGDTLGNVWGYFGTKPLAIGDTLPDEAGKTLPLILRADVPDQLAADRLPVPAMSDVQDSMLDRYELDELAVNKIADGILTVRGHTLPKGPAPLASVSNSSRTRLLLLGFEDGTVNLDLMTNHNRIINTTMTESGKPIDALAMSPRENGIIGLSGNHLYKLIIDKKHPEASFTSLFLPIWYEGYPKADFTWQSSSGDDAFEPKLGLMPLIFGTLKATFYSMFFAVPLALLAAVYTSEFLHPKVKARVKPVVEMMASLPSVVLGFLAGLVFAPFLEDKIPMVLAVFFFVPVAFMIGAYIWQLLPRKRQLLFANIGVQEARGAGTRSPLKRFLSLGVLFFGGVRLLLLIAMLAVGLLIATVMGPLLEDVLFAGNLKLWLAYDWRTADESTAQYANGLGGWIVVLLPVAALMVAYLMFMFLNQRVAAFTSRMTPFKAGLIQFAKFGVGLAATVGLAVGLGLLLLSLGIDPRGPIMVFGHFNLAPFGGFDQRNALIVGFVMGFAVIPIIYTIAEDALSSVPEHLRSASLGCGATQWQTATRIIIPTAMSGLFSACMIGLGRAVGETMIVLMAAGNTPVLSANMFKGFRTLSANIAVEMPEAVKDSTHYRTLFLAALCLFVMTFFVNTIAEGVRIRFRNRTKGL